MQITLLGTGTPILETDRQGSAVLLQTAQHTLLFDAGRGVNTQMLRAGSSPDQIDYIFITHHHADHIGDLGDVIVAAWHAGREKTLKITGPHGTATLVTALLDHVYRRDIDFAMRLEQQLGNSVSNIRDMIEVVDIGPGLAVQHDDFKVFAETVDHGSSFLNFADDEWPCLGYRIEAEGKVIALSGDTIPCDGLYRLANGADILIQCCYLASDEITNPAFELLSQRIIASSQQVGKVAAQANVTKLVLTHFRKKSGRLMQSILSDVQQDFAGEVILGHDLLTIEL